MRPPVAGDFERILVFGGAGVGKTLGVLRVADWYMKTGTEGRFWVLDTDNTMARMLSPKGQFAHLNVQLGGNVDVEAVYEWPEYLSRMKDVKKRAGGEDWIVIDMVSPAWDACQEHYVDSVFGKSMDTFFLEARKAQAKGNPLDGFKDWTVINKMYREFSNEIVRARCHVYATAAATSLVANMEEKDTVQVFGPLGAKPQGQKHTPHLFHTNLYLQKERDGWYVRTAKDRERPELSGQRLTDFAKDYLMGVAGWTL